MTYKELFEALLAGKKIMYMDNSIECLDPEGNLVNSYGNQENLGAPRKYTILPLPDPKSRQVLYKHSDNGTYGITIESYATIESFNIATYSTAQFIRFVEPGEFE